MEWTEVIILAGSFVCLLALGVPIAWCIGISTLVTMLYGIESIAAMTTVASASGPVVASL